MPTTVTTTELETAVRLRSVIGRLARRLRPTPAARAAGLTPTKSSVLLGVVGSGATRLADLAASESLNPTMLSRVIADLAQSGLLARTSDEGDRRSAWVAATPAGERLAERIRRERTDALGAALERLSEAERNHLERALGALEALAVELGEGSR
ncbi:MAG: MarR family transcriptional regulator [Gammaproteobacteria bacterium]|nr:MarR family transcriptional regulator [Gammaproteobacteria bacterium]